MPKLKRKSGPCAVEGCGIRARRYGYCPNHASKFRKYGDPLVNKKHVRGKCSLDECDSPHYMKGYCIKHYQRWRKRGDPLSLGQAPHHTGTLQNGYRVIMKNGITKAEHRWIMEEYLGRPLLRTEIVHHKDENPLNNTIDNLQVMTHAEHMRLHKTGKKWKRRSKKDVKV